MSPSAKKAQPSAWLAPAPIEDLSQQYECVRQWLLNLSQGTHRNYKFYLRKFAGFSGWNPDQILERAQADSKGVHIKLKEFWYQMRDHERLASNTRASAYRAVRSFLFWHDLPIGKTPREFHGKVQYEPYHALEPQEISLMIDYARSARDQALITFLAQSGQRVGILTALKYGQIQDQVERGVNPVLINVTPEMIGQQGVNVNKGKVLYSFAIGREATSFLRICLNHRQKAGEQINAESWLFRSTGRFEGRFSSVGRPIWSRVDASDPSRSLNATGIRYRILSVARRAGLDKVRKRMTIGGRCASHSIHPHIFRRWWKFQMRKAGVVDSDLLEHMMGHHNLRLTHGGNYDEFDPDYIRKEYAKAEPFLTVTSDPVSHGVENTWHPGDPVPRLERPSTIRPNETTPSLFRQPATKSQRVVGETELNKYFELGWQYVTTLQSGKVIIGLPS